MIQGGRAASFMLLEAQAIGEWLLNLDDNDKRSRNKTPFHQRLDWDAFVKKNKDRPLFRRHLRMDYTSFCKLLSLIDPHQKEVNNEMALLRGGEVIKELRLYATLRYLAGGSYSDICFFCGISKSSFYRILWDTIHAINKSLKIEFPQTLEQCATVAAQFEKLSYQGVMKNVVGVIDGYLINITTPKRKRNRNIRSYFSGHYQTYGINVQACCDAFGRFSFLGIGGPGVIKDRAAIKESGLHDKVERIPQGYVVIGDCAYQPTERLVSIFGGNLALISDHDNFNYFASQLRIRIEMAFGSMTRKWGILQRPLTTDIEKVKYVILAIARLHNFCINERLDTRADNVEENLNFVNEKENHGSKLNDVQLAYMTIAADLEYEEILSNEYPQWSLARERLVKDVKEKGLSRPSHSILQRKQKMKS